MRELFLLAATRDASPRATKRPSCAEDDADYRDRYRGFVRQTRERRALEGRNTPTVTSLTPQLDSILFD